MGGRKRADRHVLDVFRPDSCNRGGEVEIDYTNEPVKKRRRKQVTSMSSTVASASTPTVPPRQPVTIPQSMLYNSFSTVNSTIPTNLDEVATGWNSTTSHQHGLTNQLNRFPDSGLITATHAQEVMGQKAGEVQYEEHKSNESLESLDQNDLGNFADEHSSSNLLAEDIYTQVEPPFVGTVSDTTISLTQADTNMVSLFDFESKSLVPHSQQDQPSSVRGRASTTALNRQSSKKVSVLVTEIDEEVSSEDETPQAGSRDPESLDGLVGVPTRKSDKDVTLFELALAIWCEAKNITSRDYQSLREVLCLRDPDIEDDLPKTMASLIARGRDRMPLPQLRQAKVLVQAEQQPSNTFHKSEQLWYLDPREHGHCWGSFIRTCSGECAWYPDQDREPIFPSDFITYHMKEKICLGRVIFIGIDRRSTSQTKGEHILRVQRVVPVVPSDTISTSYEPYILLEHKLDEVLVNQVIQRESDVQIKRTFQPAICSRCVTLVYNLGRQEVRSVNLLHAIRGELELEHFGREHLRRCICLGVRSYPLLCFIDDFGLYRNMYRALCGIYLTPACLTLLERQRISNMYPITLGPHGVELNDVVDQIKPFFLSLEKGAKLSVNGEELIVWAPIIAYTGDMKQQQAAAGFMGARANLSCRMCFADSTTRDNMYYDTVKYSRYHHAVLEERKRIDALPRMTERNSEFAANGMASVPSALQFMSPALDLVHSRPGDPAHSEFAGVVRRVTKALCTKILTKKSLTEFTKQFRMFPFPSGWGRIQSPQTHRGSWTISECARASVIIPMVLRCWPLNAIHIRGRYRDAIVKSRTDQMSHLSPAELIVYYFAMIAKSNSLISCSFMSTADRQNFMNIILTARVGCQRLLNAAVIPSSSTGSKPAAPAKGKRRVRAVSETTDASINSDDTNASMAMAIDKPFEDEEAKAAALPNIHAAVHFGALTQEYGLLWNVNVLPGERFHKFFKNAVLATNHKGVVRQLLLKASVQMTIRLAINGSFRQSDQVLTTALQCLKTRCPSMFLELMTILKEETGIPEDDGATMFVEDKAHTHISVLGLIKGRLMEEVGMPVTVKTGSDSRYNSFGQKLLSALADYEITSVNLGGKRINWYSTCSFNDPLSKHRITLHRGQYIETLLGQYARIDWIFTHAFDYDLQRRVFLIITDTHDTGTRDSVLNVPLLTRGIADWRMIGLLRVKAVTPYILPLKDGSLLHCDWKIKFL